MAYVCDLGSGQRLYLDNQGAQTAIASIMSAPGQQQQSSSSFKTGTWTQPPQLFQTVQGLLIKLITDRGEVFIQVQGQSLQVIQDIPGLQQAQQLQTSVVEEMPGVTPMQPMEPMQPMGTMPNIMPPMEPMTMGNMQMSLEPMQMQMGNMKMQMGSKTPANPSPTQTQQVNQRRFCTQCGQEVDVGDRFCAACGHSLVK